MKKITILRIAISTRLKKKDELMFKSFWMINLLYSLNQLKVYTFSLF